MAALYWTGNRRMKFPGRGQDIIASLCGKNQALALGDDDARRLLTRMIAAQMAFELGTRWGTKTAGVGRPQSKDSISYDSEPVINWDWQDGASRQPKQIAGTDGEPLPGQIFFPVTAQDYLGVSVTSPTPSIPGVTVPAVPVETKPITQSKTIWFNVAAIVATYILGHEGALAALGLDAQTVVLVVGAANLVLRAISSKALTFSLVK